MFVGVFDGVLGGVSVIDIVGVTVGVLVGVCEIVGVTVGVLVGVTVGVGDRSGSVQAALLAQSYVPVVYEKKAEFGCCVAHTDIELPGVTIAVGLAFPLSGHGLYIRT